MEINKSIYVTRREDWRAWLEENYASENEVWLIFYKKPSRNANIPYDDAVEEALCFGWIDSLIQKIDEESYARKFTRRVNHTKWSPSNIQRVEKLIREGRMTQAGLAKFALPNPNPPDRGPKPEDLALAEPVLQVLRANPKAWENFNRLSPTSRKQYMRWINSAKRAETQLRRAREAVELLERGEKLGLR